MDLSWPFSFKPPQRHKPKCLLWHSLGGHCYNPTELQVSPIPERQDSNSVTVRIQWPPRTSQEPMEFIPFKRRKLYRREFSPVRPRAEEFISMGLTNQELSNPLLYSVLWPLLHFFYLLLPSVLKSFSISNGRDRHHTTRRQLHRYRAVFPKRY